MEFTRLVESALKEIAEGGPSDRRPAAMATIVSKLQSTVVSHQLQALSQYLGGESSWCTTTVEELIKWRADIFRRGDCHAKGRI